MSGRRIRAVPERAVPLPGAPAFPQDVESSSRFRSFRVHHADPCGAGAKLEHDCLGRATVHLASCHHEIARRSLDSRRSSENPLIGARSHLHLSCGSGLAPDREDHRLEFTHLAAKDRAVVHSFGFPLNGASTTSVALCAEPRSGEGRSLVVWAAPVCH
jgi:hypothetical protein